MANRAEQARLLCHDAFALYQREKNRVEEKAVWSEAATLFRQSVLQAYPENFWEAFESLKQRDSTHLDAAINFLENDPWFFGSGYVKADLIRFICRLNLSTPDCLRLQQVVLAAIDLRDRREFRWYCKLANRVSSKLFRTEVEKRLSSEDKGSQRRARWVLSAINCK